MEQQKIMEISKDLYFVRIATGGDFDVNGKIEDERTLGNVYIPRNVYEEYKEDIEGMQFGIEVGDIGEVEMLRKRIDVMSLEEMIELNVSKGIIRNYKKL